MSIRSVWVVALGVIVPALALVSATHKREVIMAEPEAVAPGPERQPADREPLPGLAAPMPSMASRPAPHTPRQSTGPTLSLDYVEPWTGEDLAPLIVATRSPQRGLERVDPWDPSIVHPTVTPRHMDLDEDPWGDPIASIARGPAMKKSTQVIDKTSPWDNDPAAGPSTSRATL